MLFDNILLIGAFLIFVSILVGKIGSKFGIPSLLLFLFVGMLFGSDGLGIEFYNAKFTQFIGMIALSIILFSGGMETRFTSIRPVLAQGIALSTLGVLVTALTTGLFVYWMSGFEFTSIYMTLLTSILLAATVSSTDSASVFNILRSQNIRLKYNIKSILELESGSNDPMAYMLTIALIQAITQETTNISSIILSFIIQFVLGGLIGFLAGKAIVWLINKISLKVSSLYCLLLMSLVFFTFSITDILHGNGYLAVYIAGIIVGNKRIVNKNDITTFLDGMTMLFQIIMFLSLGLLVNPSEMVHVIPIGIMIALFMMFIGRPLSVFISLLPFRKMRIRSKLFISWVGLRGAVPIIFATYPVVSGIEYSDQIFNIVFVITLLSLTFQGMTIPKAAKLFKLIMPPQRKQEDNFGMTIPDKINANLREITLTEFMLQKGNTLKEIKLPDNTLAVLIKRGEDYIVPNGSVELMPNDTLLLISSQQDEL